MRDAGAHRAAPGSAWSGQVCMQPVPGRALAAGTQWCVGAAARGRARGRRGRRGGAVGRETWSTSSGFPDRSRRCRRLRRGPNAGGSVPVSWLLASASTRSSDSAASPASRLPARSAGSMVRVAVGSHQRCARYQCLAAQSRGPSVTATSPASRLPARSGGAMQSALWSTLSISGDAEVT